MLCVLQCELAMSEYRLLEHPGTTVLFEWAFLSIFPAFYKLFKKLVARRTAQVSPSAGP